MSRIILDVGPITRIRAVERAVAQLLSSTIVGTGGVVVTGNPEDGFSLSVPFANPFEVIAYNDTKAVTAAGIKPLIDAVSQSVISTAGLATGGGQVGAGVTISVPKANPFEFAAYDDSKALTSLIVKGETDQKLNRAAKATGAEAIAGQDVEKWVGPYALKQALNAKIVEVAASENPDLEAIQSQIDDRALADLSNVSLPVRYLRHFTSAGDDTDVTLLVNLMLAALATAGGGHLDVSGLRVRISSADLVVPEGCGIVGPWRTLGTRDGLNFGTAKGVLLIDSARTIRLYRSATISGVGILRFGMATPTNYREGLDLVAASAGTAITYMGPEASVENVFIGGFVTPVNCTGHERPRLVNLKIDCLGPIILDTVYDMQHVRDIQRWPFLTTPQTWPTFEAVTGADSDGGLIRLTVASHRLVPGDQVTAYGIGGVLPVSTRRYTIASTTPTSVTLADTVFSGSYTGGGSIFVNSSRRKGRAFSFQNTDDWGQASDSFQYGYDEGWVIDSSDHTTLVNTGSDNFVTAADPTSVGFHLKGTANAHVNVAGKAAAQGTGLRVDTTALYERHYTFLGFRAWNSVVNDYDFRSGKISVIGGGVGIHGRANITSGAERVAFIGVDLDGLTFTYGAGAQAKTRIVECFGQVNQLSPTAVSDRVVIRGASQGGQLVLGYGGDTTNVITQGGPSCWFMDVEAGAGNPLRFFRQNAGGAVMVAARVDEGTGKFNLYGGLRLDQTLAVVDIYDSQALAAGAGGQVNLLARNDTNQAVPYAGIKANVQSGATGGEAGSLDLYSRGGGALTLRARLDNDGAFQMGPSPITVIDANRLVRLRSYTVATLPSAASAGAGATAFVSDSSSPVFGATVTGGGSTQIPVHSDGSNWKVG